MSPSGRPSSRAFSKRRIILPERVLGITSTGSYLARSDRRGQPLPREPHQFTPQVGRPFVIGVEGNERLHDLHGDRIGLANHARFSNGRVLDQCAFDLERPDKVTGRVDHVVRPALEPEIPVFVQGCLVARDVPSPS